MLPAARAAAGQAGAAARPQPQRGHQLQLQLRALRLPQPPAALAGRHGRWARRPCPPAPEYRRREDAAFNIFMTSYCRGYLFSIACDASGELRGVYFHSQWVICCSCNF